MAYSSFESLDVWRRACELAVQACRGVEDMRQFALRNQMQRAAISIPSNIAEGSERDSTADYIRFLRIAKGSAAELRTQLIIANRLGLVDDAAFRSAHDEASQIGAMLQGLIRALGGGQASLKDEASPDREPLNPAVATFHPSNLD